jgi:hypothetical protein
MISRLRRTQKAFKHIQGDFLFGRDGAIPRRRLTLRSVGGIGARHLCRFTIQCNQVVEAG